MTAMSVERSLVIGAPIERVWAALAEPDQLAQWFLPPMGAQLQRADDGTLTVILGPMTVDLAVMDGLEPPRQFRLTSLPERQITTTCTLTPEAEATRVTIHMTGFEALPAPGGTERLAPSGAAWEKALLNLKAFMDVEALPYPEGYLSALLGYRREKLHKLTVERSLWLNAPRERVWRAITDPKQIQKWFSPGMEWRVTTLEAGGRLTVVNPETGAEEYGQLIELVDPPRQLILRSEPPAVAHTTVWTLEEENGGTRATLTDEGYELEAEDVRHATLEQNTFGYVMMLANLRAVVEGQALPFPAGF